MIKEKTFSGLAVMKNIVIVSILLLGLVVVAIADGPYGSRQHRKRGVMDGNLVATQFYNYGMIADWPNQPSGVWPKGTSHSYIDGVAMIVMASTYDEDGNLIHPLSSQYREDMDSDPITNEYIGWEPLPGFANPNQHEPAMSDNPTSWPWTWPDREHSWDGFWNGYFGKGVTNADLETYFRMDDSKDNEFNYYPDSTDQNRKGLGLDVGVRAFQWNHVLAEDCIFWHYDIKNISTTDYDSTVFGFLIDWGVGGTNNSSDDAGSYFTDIDLAYAWDGDGVGDNGWSPVGFAGFAFLESPGDATDGEDNDEDGLVDESRDDGIDNDGDWEPYSDRNFNGEWDEGEPLNDDLGADGIGPNDLAYTMPDAGEGDGLPTPGEPDFDALDKDESDQIGLTAFLIFPLHQYQLVNEEQNWQVASRLIPPTEEQIEEGVNLGMMFYSGTFPLYTERTERFSMALLFGNNVDDLVRNKTTVQAIYNANYNFAQPPFKPTLTATAGDQKVTLFWDEFAENSYDRFLQEYDFEGYRIYRSTDPSFIDSKVITDAYGNPTFRKPLAQYDLVDGRFGPHPVNVYGASFDIGNDTGLRHSYIDTTVHNGLTYYYAVVSYDYGFIQGEEIVDTLVAADGTDSVVVRFLPELDPSGNIIGIAPTECTSTIIGEVGGNVGLDINTAEATPNAPAAGYQPPQLENGLEHVSGKASGTVNISILQPDSLMDGHTYEITFQRSDQYGEILNLAKSFTVTNITTGDVLYQSPDEALGYFGDWVEGDPLFWLNDGILRRNRLFMQDPNADTLQYWHQSQAYIEPPILEGFSLTSENAFIDWADDKNTDEDSTYYIPGDDPGNYGGEIRYLEDANGYKMSMKLPYDYEIRFFDEIMDTSSTPIGYRAEEVNFELWNTTLEEKSEFVYIETPDSAQKADGTWDTFIKDFWVVPYIPVEDTLQNRIRHVFGLGFYSYVNSAAVDTVITDSDTTITRTEFEIKEYGQGTVIGFTNPVPFSENDVYRFTVRQGYLDNMKEKQGLRDIAVVPNPYVATAIWEPKVNFTSGRGPRKIDFINLPKKCTIRIYTLSGYLVKELFHDTSMSNGAESWNLVSKDGMDVAYGVYLYHVDAPGVGEHVGKFALIK